MMRRLADLLTERQGPPIGLLNFWSGIALAGDQRRAKRGLQLQFLLGTRRSVRQRLEHLQPLPEMTDGFHVRRALDGAMAGPLPVTHGPIGEPRLGEVIREYLGLRLDGLGKSLGQHLRDLLMILLSRASEQRLVSRVLDERVLERVRGLGREPSLVEQLGFDEAPQRALKRR